MISLSTLRNLVVGAALIAAPNASFAGVFIGISVNIAPPALPVYVQPPLPAPGYLWTPGYWAYGPAGYYWVPGVWVQPPTVGYLWTPGYWGFAGGVYGWHGGYWGPHVGFYGGVNYGFGYGGIGFAGGEWRGGAFAYNSAVANFGSVHVTNVYRDTTIVERTTIINNNHTSFNGPGGVARQPSPQEQQFANERHVQPTPNQMQHETAASQDRGQLAAVNHGRPATMAASNPGQYHQVAAQHMQSQPISASDREAGKGYNPQRDGFGHANEVNARQGNQQQRINQGVRSGQLTPGETRNLENRDSSINRQAQTDRQNNGGRLTGQEKQQINQRQNNVSNSINRDDHNANNDHNAAARNGAAPRQEKQQAEHVEKNNAPHPKEEHPKER